MEPMRSRKTGFEIAAELQTRIDELTAAVAGGEADVAELLS